VFEVTSWLDRGTLCSENFECGAPGIFGNDLALERNFLPIMVDVWSFGTC
jgi:hypothetical protein